MRIMYLPAQARKKMQDDAEPVRYKQGVQAFLPQSPPWSGWARDAENAEKNIY